MRAATLIPFIQQHIPAIPGTVVYTDEMPSYNHLSRLGFNHETVQHAAKQYVNGTAHTNNVESLWSNTKRGIDGVHSSVSPKYLQSYLDACIFRFNHRDDKRAMYETLTNKIKVVRDGKHGIYAPLTDN